MSHQYTRRELLHRMGGTAAIASLSNFVPVLEADAATNGMLEGVPMRYLYWYTPTVPFEDFMKTIMPDPSTAGGDLAFKNEFSALNEMTHKMSYIRGLTNTLAQQAGNRGVNGGHRASGFTMLSGWAPDDSLPGDTPLVESGAVGLRGHSTLDYWLIEKLQQKFGIQRPIERIAMGHRNFAHNKDASWRSVSVKKGVLQLNHQSPSSLYDQMFSINGGNTAGSSTGSGGQFELAYQRNVLDSALASLNKLKNKISHTDNIRLDQHLTAIREVERQLDVAEAVASSGGSCTFAESSNVGLDIPMDQAVEAYINLLTVAFNCDLSRVGGMYMLSHIGDNVNTDPFLGHRYQKSAYAFLPEAANINNGQGRDYHHITHITGETSASPAENAYLMGGMRWRAEIFVKLLKSFDSIIEANGKTLLDNTITHWYTENSFAHVYGDQFNIIAGGADYFKMGKHLNVGTTGKKDNAFPQTMLLKSIASAFGLDPSEGLIDPNYDTGDINQIVFA